jgi:hypothetical protein
MLANLDLSNLRIPVASSLSIEGGCVARWRPHGFNSALDVERKGVNSSCGVMPNNVQPEAKTQVF